MALDPELTLEQAVLDAVDAGVSQVWTSVPGRITSWDPVRQEATVQITVRDGALELPDVHNVRVHFPRAGGYLLVLPVGVGTPGLLLVSARSPAQWFASSAVAESADQRRHQLSFGVFLPGWDPTSIEDLPSACALGRESNLTQLHPVALGDRLDSFVSTLDNVLRNWVIPPTPDGGLALQTAYKLAFPTTPGSMASTDVSVTDEDP